MPSGSGERAIKKSMVQLLDAQGKVRGCGLLVDSRHVVTCAHVVALTIPGVKSTQTNKPTEAVRVAFPYIRHAEDFSANVDVWKPAMEKPPPDQVEVEDVAVLKLDKPAPTGTIPHGVVLVSDWAGRGYRALGFPESESGGAWADGTFRGELTSGWVQMLSTDGTDLQVDHGFSGGGVWDLQMQEFAGIMVANKKRGGQMKPVSYMIPGTILKEAWSDLPVTQAMAIAQIQENDELRPITQRHDTNVVQIGTMNGVILAGHAPEEILTRSYRDSASQPVRFVFTSVAYPAIEFSIANISPFAVQVTSIFGLPLARSKFETRSTRSLEGPRYELSLDLNAASPGRQSAASRRDVVYNLRSGEIEAFRLRLTTANLIWLLELQAVVITPVDPAPVLVRSQEIMLCAAASDLFAGFLEVINKRDAVERIFSPGTTQLAADRVPEINVELDDLLYRGSAFISDADLTVWRRLREQFESQDTWGTILASYSEFGAVSSLPREISCYIDGWLRDPQAIRRIVIWDHEIRSVSILEGRLKVLPANARIPAQLDILDQTISLPDYSDTSGDTDEYVHTSLHEMSLFSLRNRVAVELAREKKTKAVEVLMAFLLTGFVGSETMEELRRLTGTDIGAHTYDQDAVINSWIEWWITHRAPGFQGIDLQTLAPRMADTLKARTSEDGLERFVAVDCPSVRANLAVNPRTPDAVLLALARDNVTEVRRVLAEREHLPHSVAELLARDGHPVVRLNLAWNPACDGGILQILKTDPDEAVRKAIETRLARQQEQAEMP